MNNFNIFESGFIKFCENQNFNFKFDKNSKNETKSFTVLIGDNGVGKSRLLKLIREYIENDESMKEKYIVKRLGYCEHDDYDPDTIDLPLFTTRKINEYSKKLISSYNHNISDDDDYFIDNFDNLHITECDSKTKKKAFRSIFEKFYLGKDNELDRIKNMDENQKKNFDKFKNFFRHQVIKKYSYGSLKQLLMLNIRYQFEIEEINKNIESISKSNDYCLQFPYKIEKNCEEFTETSDVNDHVVFKRDDTCLRFRDLSPGERLILHLILLIKDKENIKMDNFDQKTKLVLLLDQPDSHCGVYLVEEFIKVIKKLIVDDMNIQVIMSTHNYLTISSKYIDKDSFYLMEYCENNQLKIINDKENFLISFENESSVRFLNKILDMNYDGSLHGILIEYFIKHKFQEFYEKNPKNFFSLIEILIHTNFKNIELKDFDLKKNKKYLNDFNFGDSEFNHNKIYIIWPKEANNKAWDLMILDKFSDQEKPRLHLLQIKKNNVSFKDTMEKHIEIINR